MPKSTLDSDGQDRLKKAKDIAGGDYFKIHQAITEALRGVNERGRRVYLWNQLQKRLTRNITAAQKAIRKSTAAPAMRHDAHAHEMSLTRGHSLE
jgi:hypothetical protein